jgi:hypothetical protein
MYSALALSGFATFVLTTSAQAVTAFTAPQTSSTAALGTAASITELINAPLTFNKFDPSLGTLTDVEISGSLAFTSTGVLTNTAQTPETFDFTTNIFGTLTSTDVSGVTGLSTTASEDTGFITLAPGGTQGFNFSASNTMPGITLTSPPSDLSSFVGSGTYNLLGNTLSGTSFVGGGGNIQVSQVTNAQFTGTVIYSYTPKSTVPEPGAVGLLSAGSLGILTLLARRRK